MNRLAFRDLVGAPGAAILTLLGLLILAFSYLLLAALSDAIGSFTQSGAPVKNLMLVEGGILNPEDSQVDPNLTSTISTTLGDDLARLSPMIFRVLRIEGHVVQIRATAVEDWPSVFGLQLTEGRWPAGPGEVAIGAGTAHFTGWQLEDQLTIYGSTFRVVALLDAPGGKFLTVWMPLASARDLFGPNRGVQFLVANLRPGADPLSAHRRLESQFTGGEYAVYLEDAIVSELAEAMRDLRGLARLSTWIAVAAVTLGAYNLTRLAADERRRALGLLRAVGFSPGSIHRYLLARMTALSAAAYFVALAGAGPYLAALQNRHPIIVAGAPLPLELQPAMVTLGLGLTIAATLAGTWLSARQVLSRRVAQLLGRGPGATPR